MEGRLQEVIQVFGWKVFPFKIENVIKTMSNISSAIVMSLKDKETGDLPLFYRNCLPSVHTFLTGKHRK